MRKNKNTRKNKGYTLIEAIIVIAIIAILSGMSFVTIGIIKQAKCNAAASALDAQMGSLLIKTKAVSEAKDSPLCMLIQYNNSDINFADGTIAKRGSYSLILGYNDGSSFTPKEVDADGNAVVETTLPNILSINYTPEAGAGECSFVDGTETMLIEFKKADGSVRYGAGSYEIIYNGNKVATVKLDAATGNHSVK
ncbi:MAG: prepilin-type N-terminal cleavage/methylation domain-containing protein [Lachnospiraceae bacterium]|nr:prepilin-type N-terminal cleavage/methylation domain-containing protein [Lachnospiraceae bacterium]